MSAMLKTCATSLLLAASFAALAADDTSLAAQPSASLGQVAVRDAASGQLRAPTASELKTLQAAAPAGAHTLKAGATRTKRHASGATGARLNDSFMSYSVVMKQPDGSLTEYCFGSKEDAEAAVIAPTPAATTQPTE
jgi:hypothetical protein